MTTTKNLMGTGSSAFAAQAALGMITQGAIALGSSQGTALALPSDFVVFTNVAGSTGTILPTSSVPDWITIVNHGANTLTVYPPVGGAIANGSVNAGFSVAANKTANFLAISSINFAAALSA